MFPLLFRCIGQSALKSLSQRKSACPLIANRRCFESAADRPHAVGDLALCVYLRSDFGHKKGGSGVFMCCLFECFLPLRSKLTTSCFSGRFFLCVPLCPLRLNLFRTFDHRRRRRGTQRGISGGNTLLPHYQKRRRLVRAAFFSAFTSCLRHLRIDVKLRGQSEDLHCVG